MQKFPIILRNLEKCPECLQRFRVEMAREILSKRNFFDFESPDSAISLFPQYSFSRKFECSVNVQTLWYQISTNFKKFPLSYSYNFLDDPLIAVINTGLCTSVQ
jgi:hypothetical protein